MFAGKNVYLASASPRRREILENLGFSVHLLTIAIDEAPRPHELPSGYVQRMAEEKNQAARAHLSNNLHYPLISADTTVVSPQGEILGKPQDAADAARMLRLLSGQSHQVLSAVCVSVGNKYNTLLSESRVTFAALTEAEIAAYIASKEPLDKAGAYGVQGLGGVFVRHLSGSFSGVMGLPVYETVTLLKQYF